MLNSDFNEEENEGFDLEQDEFEAEAERLAKARQVYEELGLKDVKPEDMTREQLEKLIQTECISLKDFTGMGLWERNRGGVDEYGRYNEPALLENDLMLAKLGYFYDKDKKFYVKKDLPVSSLPGLSEIGKKIIERDKEQMDIMGADDMSGAKIMERIFNHDLPLLPEKMLEPESISEQEIEEMLVEHISRAQNIRLVGYDHEIDMRLTVRKAYLNTKAKINLIYHPEYTTADGSEDHEFDSFLTLLEKIDNCEMCAIQPEQKRFTAFEKGDDDPFVDGRFTNHLRYCVKAIDDKLLMISDLHNLQGPTSEVIKKPEGIAGFKQGFSKDFDKFFTADPPYQLKPLGGTVVVHAENGHLHIFDYRGDYI